MGYYDAGLTYNATNAKPRTLSESDLQEIVSVAGWHGASQDCAVRVILAESSGKSDATSANPDGNQNIGLFQIDTVNVRCANCLKDTVYNANVARRMWLADGGTFTKRWSTAHDGNLPTLSNPGGPSDEATNPTDDVSRKLDFLGNLTLPDVGKMVLGGALIIVAALFFVEQFSPTKIVTQAIKK